MSGLILHKPNKDIIQRRVKICKKFLKNVWARQPIPQQLFLILDERLAKGEGGKKEVIALSEVIWNVPIKP